MQVPAGIFRQYDVRGVVGADLTPDVARVIGTAYARQLAAIGRAGRIALGRDNRPSGAALRDAFVAGVNGEGVDVLDIGVVPTPLLYWTLHHSDVAGGVQITGSHNPPEYNGFKLCAGTSSLHGDAIRALYARAAAAADEAPRRGARPPAGSVEMRDVIGSYVDDLVERVGPLARPLRVVIDCGNGAASLVAATLYDRLGVRGRYLFCESDGTFPNHHPDPTVVENLRDCVAAVRAERADLGIAFDGDGDRIGVVSESGRIVWGDQLLILYARDVLARSERREPIIFDVKCSQSLADAVAAAGGEPVMWKTGHSLIKEKMRELAAPLAGEMSGHMFFAEGFYGHDDALYAGARLLRIVASAERGIDDLLADVPPSVITPEIRVDCPDERKFDIVADAARTFAEQYPVVAVDGARVLFDGGWGLIRASNTQPVLVLRFEARDEERLHAIRTTMETWLRSRGVAV